MGESRREQLTVERKTAVLVGVLDPAHKADRDHALDELEGLATTAGVRVVDRMVQVRPRPHPALCLGRGKLEELKRRVAVHDAGLIVFDNNLSPAQCRNLEEATDTIVVDRSEVILAIFATRAQTYEAKLQVELAQLLYFRPRLKRMWTHLERVEGGISTGRGPGEKQLETDRRLIDRRVAALQPQLRTIERRRQCTVEKRQSELTVSLVGYTNAGKSTLMRALCGADVLVADKLFATLDTCTRRWRVPNCGDVLLSDTVGFVRDLPHHLVASFRSTLEEARHADVLLHVVDASHPQAAQQIKTVNTVLDEIGVDTRSAILALNKIDRLTDRAALDILRAQHAAAFAISASTGRGLDRLTVAVSEQLGRGFVEAEVEVHAGDGRLLAWLAQHASVTDTVYRDSLVSVRCRIARRLVEQLNRTGATVHVTEPAAAG